MNMEHIVGIDLGTTSSRIAVFNGKNAVIIENTEGDGTTPSHVAITKTNQCLIGKPARRYALKDPLNVVFAIKRIIGRKYDDNIVQKLKPVMPYEIIKLDNDDAGVLIQNKRYSPVEIDGYMLYKLKQSAEIYLGESIKYAVITVPADFNERQRLATKKAAQLAGINVVRMYAEPAAAALAYGFGKIQDETIAVYDLGGGTFDVSILQLGEGVYEVKSTAGDMFLGGEDFDLMLVEYIIEEYEKLEGICLKRNPIALLRLKEAAETAKILLSSEYNTEIELPFIAADHLGPKHLQMTITRNVFEGLIKELVSRTIEVCRKAVDDSFIEISEIGRVILVGGSTRIPLVHNSLKEYFGEKIYAGQRREDMVAIGAAITGGVLGGNIRDVLLLDAIPKAISYDLGDGKIKPAINANSTIPTRNSVKVSINQDINEELIVKFYFGNEKDPSNDQLINLLSLKDICSPDSKEFEAEVTVDIDANGLINIFVKNLATGEKVSADWESIARFIQFDTYQNNNTDSLSAQSQERASMSIPFSRDHNVSMNENPGLVGIKSLDKKEKALKPIIFISYAHEDQAWAQLIEKSLRMLVPKSYAEVWIDRSIPSGDLWEDKIYSMIERATAAVLIISQDFLSSNFIINNELPRIFAESERRYLKLFPVAARFCSYELNENISKFQFFNNPEIPLSMMQPWEIDKEMARLTSEMAKEVVIQA